LAKSAVDQASSIVQSSNEPEQNSSESETQQEEAEKAHVEQAHEPIKVEQHETKPAATAVSASSSHHQHANVKEKILSEIPNYAQYLIVGGGTAAMAAFKAIRANDAKAKVLVVTEENYKPYMRPPLSKELWTTEDDKLVEQLKFKQYNGNERRYLSIFFSYCKLYKINLLSII
jgi:apoptosis-inducing factor 1